MSTNFAKAGGDTPVITGRLDPSAIVAAARARRVAYVAGRFAGTWQRLGGLLASVQAWWHAGVQRRRTRAELLALTDRELVDIGLRRGDIERVVREAANWNHPTRRAA